MTLEEYDALLSRYSEGDITWPEFRERLNEADNYPELLNALIQRLPRPARVLTLTQDEQDDLIRRYAAREITWRELREYDEFEHYGDVIMALGRLDLRIPIAPMEGPNVESRLRGRAILRELLHKQSAELAKQGLRWVAGKLCRVNPDGSTVPVETE